MPGKSPWLPASALASAFHPSQPALPQATHCGRLVRCSKHHDAPIGDRHRAFRNALLLSVFLSGCGDGDAPGNGTGGVVQQPSVVLTVDMGAGPTRGPIHGTVRCGADDPPVAGPCLPADIPLAEAVLACGPAQVAIDRGTSHLGIVRFAAGLHRRFRGIPPDLEIVRCVQQRVGFPFTAGIATDPSEAIDLDQRPFASLHAAAR